MEAKWHFIVTLATLPIAFALTGSYVALMLWLFFGFLIDADHEVDYVLRERKITFSAYVLSNLRYDFLILPLHCLELVPIAFLLFYFFLPPIHRYSINLLGSSDYGYYQPT